MRSRKFFGFIILLISFLTLVLAGCNANRKPLPNQTNPNQNQVGILSDQLPNLGGQKLNTVRDSQKTSETERADAISRQLVSLTNIDKAPVIINGNRAIIGIRVRDNSATKMNNLRNELSNNQNRNKNNQLLNNLRLPNASNNNQPLTPNNTNDGTNFTSLIVDKVKTIDPNITSVLVTTDSNMVDRLQNLKNTISREMEDISRNIQK